MHASLTAQELVAVILHKVAHWLHMKYLCALTAHTTHNGAITCQEKQQCKKCSLATQDSTHLPLLLNVFHCSEDVMIDVRASLMAATLVGSTSTPFWSVLIMSTGPPLQVATIGTR
jgi:hypothetical protein